MDHEAKYLARSLTAQMQLASEEWGVSPRQFNRAGLRDLLEHDMCDDPLVVGLRALKLSVGNDGYWDDLKLAITSGAMGFMEDCGFDRPSRADIKKLQAMHQLAKADLHGLVEWFNSVYGKPDQ